MTNVRFWSRLLCLGIAIGLTLCQPGLAVENTTDGKNLLDLSLEDILGMDFSTNEAKDGITMYGYMSSRLEKVYGELSVVDGQTVKTNAPHEWSLPYFNMFFRANPGKNIETFVNVASEDLEVRNMWGNIKLNNALQVKVGKVYRPFDLFNEKLDEVPTYLGIEPPELFDQDHLLVPRLTTFVLHGDIPTSNATYSYALCTDNGENGPTENVTPLGWDVRAKINNKAVVGFSGYFSNLGDEGVTSEVAVGDGSPSGGAMPWVSSDKYTVYGGFTEIQVKDLLIKAAYYQADHKVVRDPASVLTIANSTNLNTHQKENFFGDNSGLATASLTEADVVQNADYTVTTGYVQLGYFFYTPHGTFGPYAFLDWMHHPETIQKKTYGGDNEAGLTDDGKFVKYTLGLSYKPVDRVAIKLDHSAHFQKFNGKTESYPEFRLDFSYLFK
ncbi:hypothetical protein C3F09_02730 [candidate division GN15 bacterium]|uniref:Porin n=1 Tax=candidate division GN15 bacterium TaxID=2072418 RepID=A0A855XBL9_9BACT|nr:MAG: hypothetical protein C3F09_02730 [candidate division GN15 bacterium]